MLEIAKLKQTLRELVTDEGMETALRELEKNLPTDVPKYDTLLQLIARLKEIDNQRIKKIVSNEQATLQYDRLRDDVLSFFSALEESDFSKETAKKANLGGVLYRIPERMQHLKKSKCIVRVAYDESMLKDTLDTEVDVVIEALRVSKNMEVKLVDEEGDGEYFEISSRSTPEQFLEQDEYTEWIFFVKPLEIGSYPLALIISLIIVDENGKDRKKDIVLERTINVITEPVPEEAGDHTLRKAGILFALRDPSKKPAGKQPKKKPWTKVAIGILLLGALAWWLWPKIFPPDLRAGGIGAKEAKDFEQASQQQSPELLIGFLAKYKNSKFDQQARDLATQLLPKINLDSAVQVYRKKYDIEPIDRATGEVTKDEKRGESETDPPASSVDKLPRPGTDGKIDSTTISHPNGASSTTNTGLAANRDPSDGTVVPVKTSVDDASKGSWKDQDKAVKESLAWLPTTMIKIKGGTFKMGCNATKEGQCTGRAEPYHDVKINEFYISRFEVTQALWKAVMGKNPSHFDDCDLCPVEGVSWNQVQKFIEKLNELQPGCNYRLPTEAEWEYAARQRGMEQIRFGDGSGRANPANINFSSKDLPGRSTEEAGVDRERTVSVYDLKANSLGLYHISGNVWEWVQDRWHDDYVGAPADGSAWMEGDDNRRVLRGGSWDMEPFQTYNRDSKNANKSDDEVGFRLVGEVACGQ